VEVVCRDRCGLHSQGAREGAPQARQVADRFHLRQNLREAIEQQMTRVGRSAGRSLLSPIDSRGASGLDDDLQPSRRTRRDARHALFDRVHALHAAGKTQRDITAATGIGRPIVRLWLRSGRLADRTATTHRRRGSLVASRTICRNGGTRAAPMAATCCTRSGGSDTPDATPICRGSWPAGVGQGASRRPARRRSPTKAGRSTRRPAGRSRRSWQPPCA
jgi:hypothetical protein